MGGASEEQDNRGLCYVSSREGIDPLKISRRLCSLPCCLLMREFKPNLDRCLTLGRVPDLALEYRCTHTHLVCNLFQNPQLRLLQMPDGSSTPCIHPGLETHRFWCRLVLPAIFFSVLSLMISASPPLPPSLATSGSHSLSGGLGDLLRSNS